MIDLNMTLVAQILNFLILVALLRWLAYKPVVSMLKARENRIADSIQPRSGSNPSPIFCDQRFSAVSSGLAGRPDTAAPEATASAA